MEKERVKPNEDIGEFDLEKMSVDEQLRELDDMLMGDADTVVVPSSWVKPRLPGRK